MHRSEAQDSGNVVSTGDGPERAIIQQAIRVLVEDPTSWTTSDSSGWVRPIFTPSLSLEHQVRWKTAGSFLLLHLLTLGNGPEPVSPFLLYILLASALLEEGQSLCPMTLLSLKSLHSMDPGIADTLRPWMVLKETDQLSGLTGGQMHPPLMLIQNLLVQCGEYQVCPTLSSFPLMALTHWSTVECCCHEST